MAGWGPPTVFALLVASIAAFAVRPPHVDGTGRAPNLPAQRVMFSANVLAPFVSVDRGLAHVDSVLRYNATGKENPVLAAIYPGIDTLPSAGLGLVLDPEVVLARNPDRVLSWEGRDAALAAIGYPGQIELRLGAKHQVQQHLALWHQLAQLTDRADQAEDLLVRYTRIRAALKARLAHGVPAGPGPSALLLVGGYDRGYWLGPPAHSLNERFEDVGVRMKLGRGAGGIANLEHILVLDPDFIFLEPSGTGDQLVPAQLYADPPWQAVRAVREHRVYRMPALPGFSLPVEDPIRLSWLAEVLYPAAMPRAVRAQVRDTLQQAYGYAIGEDAIDRMLFVRENAASAGYDRFNRNCQESACPAS